MNGAVGHEREERPIVELARIAGPTVATMTSYTLMQFVDKLMVSRIGPEPIYVGAQGNGGIAAFVPISIAMGALTVINTYVSQNLGAKRPERAPAYAWNGVYLAVLWWLVLIPYAMALPALLRWLPERLTGAAPDPEMVRLATLYGRILLFGAVLTMSTRALAQFFYGMHRAGVVLKAGLVGNVLNVGLTYVLVFGVWGFPRMGIAGSAVATVMATGVELAIPVCVFLGPTFNRLYRTRAAWRPSMTHVRDLLRIGWPGGLMFGNEMVCWSYFMVFLVGQFGKLHSTAGWIAHQWMTLSFMPTVGISVAVTATVGKSMGMGSPERARVRALLGMRVALVYMGLCGAAFVLLRGPMVRLFLRGDTLAEDAAVVVRYGSMMLVATAAFQLFDAVAMTISGALRGAGDTVVPGVVTVVLAWVCIVVGGHAIVELAPGLESLGPWIAAASYITLLCVFLYWRFMGGRWERIRLVER